MFIKRSTKKYFLFISLAGLFFVPLFSFAQWPGEDVTVGGEVEGSPVTGTVEIDGRAYPEAFITVRKDGSVVSTFLADSSGEFEDSFTSQFGTYTFRISAIDSEGRSSVAQDFIRSVPAGGTVSISNVFISPTFVRSPSSVEQGGTISTQGEAFPGSTVQVHVDSEGIMETTTVPGNGKWSLNLNTSGYSIGTHNARARAVLGGDQSPYSQTRNFNVTSPPPPPPPPPPPEPDPDPDPDPDPEPEPEFYCESLAAAPSSGEVPLEVSFSAEAHAENTNIEEYTFEFGDGASVTTASNTTSHIYNDTGVYTASVRVHTEDGTTEPTSDCETGVSVFADDAPPPEEPPPEEPPDDDTFIGRIGERARDTYDRARDVVRETRDDIGRALNTPTGSAVTRTVSVAGVVGGGALSLSAILLSTLSFAEIFLIPLRLWTAFLGALGIKKRSRPWGTVYDSVTKQPLDPAIVALQDAEGNTVDTSVTDRDGRYGFVVKHPGIYRLIAKKTNYTFPTQKLKGAKSDVLYTDLYEGSYIHVNEPGEIIRKDIPMDPQKFDWNEFAKKKDSLLVLYSKRAFTLEKIASFLFYSGFAISLIALMVADELYNYAIVVLYLIIFAFRFMGLKPKSYGYVYENGRPLSFAIVRVMSQDMQSEITHKVADKMGRYYALVPKGVYNVKIEKKNFDGTYEHIRTIGPVEAKKGIIHSKIKL